MMAMRAPVPVVCLLALSLSLTPLADAVPAALPCVPRSFKYSSVVCVCNATYCDTLPRFQRPAANTALLFVSTKDGLRFLKDEIPVKRTQGGAGKPRGLLSAAPQRLVIDRNVTYQKVYGFGGAFTDAAGYNIGLLQPRAQELLLRSYFSAEGLEYNLGRIPIGGSDFSAREYTYDDQSRDPSLSGFQLQREDLEYKIPFVLRAKEMLPADAGELLLIAAAWSAPPWMKTNNDYSGFGFLKSEYYQTWADYHVKFLDAYQAHNLSFFACSTGNEPLNGVIPINRFNSLGWTPSTHRKWIGQHFGPTLRNSSHRDVAILALDDQRILLPWWLDDVLDETVRGYVSGVAVHWYLNSISPVSSLDSVHKRFPDKFLLATEACNGDKPWDFTKVMLGSWERMEYYVGDIISVMNHWVTGWMDWNLALNMTGGPNWARNFVDASIIVNNSTGEFYKQPMFYGLGHFSKFVPRDSVRVKVAADGGSRFGFGQVEHIAFLRPDGGISVILLNTHNSAHTVEIEEEGFGQLAVEVQPRSVSTIVYY